ncbi:MAG: F-type H+-transporting ATPase subunit delta [Granulosicoccus sp.]|jgi:F-type H+-transporting ATPase subunit delta
MAESKVAKRYAKSLLGLATELNQQDVAFADMNLLASTIDDSHDLANLLSSPVVRPDLKQSIMSKIFGNQFSELTTKFINLIIDKGRESQLRYIASNYVAQYKKGKDINTATVRTASKLLPDALAKIEALVKEQTGGTVELKEIVDPELIGGFVLRIGDKQLDTSILSELKDLRGEFDKNLYEKDF